MKVFAAEVNSHIGAVLAPYLMERGLAVLRFDTGCYRDGWLCGDNRHVACSLHTLSKDLRDVVAADPDGCDAVAHLAEFFNDPLAQNRPDMTFRINFSAMQLPTAGRRACGTVRDSCVR